MFIAVAAFSWMDALLKIFSVHYPPLQVSAMRALASIPFVVLPLWWRGALHELRPVRIELHLLRGVLGIVMLATFVYALREASLASVYSVYMGAPLLIAALGDLAARRARRCASMAGDRRRLRRRARDLEACAGRLAFTRRTRCGVVRALLCIGGDHGTRAHPQRSLARDGAVVFGRRRRGGERCSRRVVDRGARFRLDIARVRRFDRRDRPTLHHRSLSPRTGGNRRADRIPALLWRRHRLGGFGR
jgi:hypothetical protein